MIEKIKISFILLSFSIGCKSIAEISDTSEVNTNPLKYLVSQLFHEPIGKTHFAKAYSHAAL